MILKSRCAVYGGRIDGLADLVHAWSSGYPLGLVESQKIIAPRQIEEVEYFAEG
jgi:hypothetical protein